MAERLGVCWLRCGDLRLADNPALAAASLHPETAVVFPWAPDEEGEWSLRDTALELLLRDALYEFNEELRRRGSRLFLIKANSSVEALAPFVRAGAVLYYHRRTEPVEIKREREVEAACSRQKVRSKSFAAFCLKDPSAFGVLDAVDGGQHVFKAFWSAFHAAGVVRAAVPEPRGIGAVPLQFPNVSSPIVRPEASQLLKEWQPLTEDEAWRRFAIFSETRLQSYQGSVTRDGGPQAKESRLSPYFRLGLLSMVSVYWEVDHRRPEVAKWVRRQAWRDYAYWMIFAWPQLSNVPQRLAYQSLSWTPQSSPLLTAWQQGQTGYPLVDAAMRELKQTGYLQQHLRHLVGQFLVEVLHVDWVDGERWFHKTLADCDVAINAMMWQHQGLSGVSQWLTTIQCHPVREAKRIDPTGDYVRKYCPELAALRPPILHEPWSARPSTLEIAGIHLGVTYPNRVIEELDEARHLFRQWMIEARLARPDLMRGGADTMSLPNHEPIRALTEKSISGGSPTLVTTPGNSSGVGGKSLGKGAGRSAAFVKGSTHERKGAGRRGTGGSNSSRYVYYDDSVVVSVECKSKAEGNRWNKVHHEQGSSQSYYTTAQNDGAKKRRWQTKRIPEDDSRVAGA